MFVFIASTTHRERDEEKSCTKTSFLSVPSLFKAFIQFCFSFFVFLFEKNICNVRRLERYQYLTANKLVDVQREYPKQQQMIVNIYR